MLGEQQPGTVGTGRYDGFYWDGRKWRSLEDGTVGRFDPWQRTSLPLRVGLVTVAIAAIVYVALQLG